MRLSGSGLSWGAFRPSLLLSWGASRPSLRALQLSLSGFRLSSARPVTKSFGVSPFLGGLSALPALLRALQLSLFGVSPFLGGLSASPAFFARPTSESFGVAPFREGLAALPAFPKTESRFIAVTPASFGRYNLILVYRGVGYAWAV